MPGGKLDVLGGTGMELVSEGTPVDPALAPEYADEINVSLEHELAADTSVRVSYVRKNLNGDSGIWNGTQQTALLAVRPDPEGGHPGHRHQPADLSHRLGRESL